MKFLKSLSFYQVTAITLLVLVFAMGSLKLANPASPLLFPTPTPTPQPLVQVDQLVLSETVTMLSNTELLPRDPEKMACIEYFESSTVMRSETVLLPKNVVEKSGLILKENHYAEGEVPAARSALSGDDFVHDITENFLNARPLEIDLQPMLPSNYLIEMMEKEPAAIVAFSYQFETLPLWIEGIVFDESLLRTIDIQERSRDLFFAEFSDGKAQYVGTRYFNDECFAHLQVFGHYFGYWFVGPLEYDPLLKSQYANVIRVLSQDHSGNHE